jgi:hypothetical protein
MQFDNIFLFDSARERTRDVLVLPLFSQYSSTEQCDRIGRIFANRAIGQLFTLGSFF